MKLLKPLVVLILCLITFFSCKKNQNTDGEGSAGVAGNYVGRVQFQGNSLSVDRSNRLIRILREGGAESFKIEFFTGVPNITGVRFTPVNDSTWISSDTTGLRNVTIEGKLLKINYQLNSQSWIVDDGIRK